jgi:hypothetical protein
VRIPGLTDFLPSVFGIWLHVHIFRPHWPSLTRQRHLVWRQQFAERHKTPFQPSWWETDCLDRYRSQP